MANKVLNTYKTQVGEVALVPSMGGAFEVIVDGKELYSKLSTGTFPDERQLLGELDSQV